MQQSMAKDREPSTSISLDDEVLKIFAKMPDDLKIEVLHYAEYLLSKGMNKSSGVAIASDEIPKKKYRQAGTMTGMIVMLEDFDEPLADKKLEELQVEIEQKIGKNSLLFQKIEMFLKHLVSINNISGYHDEIDQIVQDKRQKVFKDTMGGLVTQFQKNNNLKTEEEHNDVDELSKAHLSFQFRIQSMTLYEDLLRVRDERNHLTHHFLLDWDMDNIDQCQNAIEYLNQQYRLAKSVMNHLIDLAKMTDESTKQMVDVMIAELIKETIIKKLVDINKQKNKNGWTSLTFAEQRLSQDISRENINKLNYTYNCGTLRDFMSKTSIFDIDDEKTAKGTKTVYRLKLDIDLDNLSILMPELVVGVDQSYKLQPNNY